MNVFDAFKTHKRLTEDALFVYETVEDADGERRMVQCLKPELDIYEPQIRRHSDRLTSLNSPYLQVPLKRLSGADYKVALVLPWPSSVSGLTWAKKGPENAAVLCRDIGHALHSLHTAGPTPLVHGGLRPDALFLTGTETGSAIKPQAHLRGFGWAPVVEQKDPVALTPLDLYLAPELKMGAPPGGRLTPACDVYSFARLLQLHLDKKIEEKEWYKKATNPNPAFRSTAREFSEAASSYFMPSLSTVPKPELKTAGPFKPAGAGIGGLKDTPPKESEGRGLKDAPQTGPGSGGLKDPAGTKITGETEAQTSPPPEVFTPSPPETIPLVDYDTAQAAGRRQVSRLRAALAFITIAGFVMAWLLLSAFLPPPQKDPLSPEESTKIKKMMEDLRTPTSPVKP